MRRIGIILAALILLPLSLAHAQSFIESAQQRLKDQGFYYGGITGQKDAETTAAVRRYQIRNGLKVTGELDVDTQRSLGLTGAPTGQFTAAATPTPAPAEENPQPRDSSSAAEETQPAAPNPSPDHAPRPSATADETAPRDSQPAMSGVFDGTPYETATLDLQQRTIVGAQMRLGHLGFYRGGIDGVFGPGTAAAVRAYQIEMELPVTARLDRQTLRMLGLLPGQLRTSGRIYAPRRVYRGEWVPE